MVGALMSVALPWKWPGLAIKSIDWCLKKFWGAVVAAWNHPKTLMGKLILRPLYVWIAIPGTVPWSLYQIGKAIGYEEELTSLMADMTTFFAGLAGVAIDLVGKVLFFIAAYLVTLVLSFAS